MKIAILGNMNNNGFSIMRYLRDLGEEADLLLFEDDGIGSSAHFSIKSDTWDYNKWRPFVKTLPAVNSYGQALSNNFISRIILKIIYPLRLLLKSKNALLTKPAKICDIDKLKQILCNYDFIIGSGATPAIMNSLNMKLSIFFAYSIGIEYLHEEFFALYRKSKNPIFQSRTIGISKNNFDFFNKEIIKFKKNIFWKIKGIEIYSEKLKNEKILNFENNNDQLFSIVKNHELYDLLKKRLKNNNFFKKVIFKNNSKFFEKYNIVFNTDSFNSINKKYFNKKILKKYNSLSYTTVVDHEKILNDTAIQIFTKKGQIGAPKFNRGNACSPNH